MPDADVSRTGLGPWCVAGVAVLVAFVVGVAILSWRTGASFPDAHQVWMLRGKVLFLDQGFQGDYFHSWRTAHDNRAYPPLLSLEYAWMHEVARSADMRSAKLLAAGYFAALLAVAYGALRRALRCGPALGLTFALGAGTTFVMLGLWGIADLPLAFYLLCAGALLIILPDGGPLPRLLPLPVAAAVLTKNEGMPLALAMVAGFALRLVLSRRGHGALRRTLSAALHGAAILLPAVALLGLWWWQCSSLGLPLQFMKPPGEATAEPDRLGLADLVLRDFGARLLEPSWLAVWLGFGLALVLLLVQVVRQPGARQGEAGRRLAVASIVVLALSAYVVVLSGYPGDLPYLLRLSSGRLVAHVVPLATVLAGTVLGGPTHGSADHRPDDVSG
jgi:hypothetical protein